MKVPASVLSVLALSAGWAMAAAPDTHNTAESGDAEIAYRLPRDAEVTVNILDAKGWIVRELLRGQEQKAGPNTLHWDGRDEMGHPLPPATYSWKLLQHTGLKAN